MLSEAVIYLRRALNQAAQDHHTDAVLHGDDRHKGHTWAHCKALVCTERRAVWEVTKDNETVDMASIHIKQIIKRRGVSYKQAMKIYRAEFNNLVEKDR